MSVIEMPQLSLFAGDDWPWVLVDDATGAIVYHPAIVDGATAARWFDEIRTTTSWLSERRMMYDREVDVPRLVARYPVDDALPAALGAALGAVRRIVPAPFTSIGLNLYRDERDSVAPHNDHLDELAPGAPIALLSLGATRRMSLRAKKRPRRVLDLDLEEGSLLVMSYETQLHYDHGIPKGRKALEARISLAFRVRP